VKLKRPLETNYNQEEVFPISIDSSHKQKNEASPFSSASDDFVVEKPVDSNLHKKFGWFVINRIYSSNGYGEEYFLKRPFDIGLSLVGILFSFPLWIIISIAIWFEDRGNPFYLSDRVGKNGKAFRYFKFRTMVPDSDERFGPLQAKQNDPRITRVGNVLRITAMDELPQLYNILRGDMSFVGPRPLMPTEIEVVKNASGEAVMLEQVKGYVERHSVTPGLTGIAQVFAPRDLIRKHKFRYDLFYIKKQCLILDIKLILLSFWITFRGKWESRNKKF
jgi:lipopolysaccharide/colanic/teichoic acid biosynthesis glycosyltransferase